MKAIRLALASVTLLAAAACGESVDGPSGTGDSIAPAVTALEPAPGARDVPVSAVVTVRFSEPINPATVGAASFLVRRGFDTVAGTYAFGDSSMSFVPAANLPFLTSVAVTVTRGIRDAAGNQLRSDTAWAFQTVGQGTPAPSGR